MNENKKKKIVYISITIVTLIFIAIGVTYAYWILTKEQTGENVVNTACLNITFTGENDINLPKVYPMTDEQLDKFLSTNTPYHFTITNECEDLANVTINLETLTPDGKQLEDQYINAVLYKENYKASLFKNKKLNEDVLNDENKVIEDSLHAYNLYSFTLKQNEEKEFNLQLYLDQETPMAQENMNASWKGKITLSSSYKEDTPIRTISSSDTNGMWGYKDKLTKIVIETKKEDKTTLEGETKYGPFNEGDGGTDTVVSYVICDSDETNCTGYLQSDGVVIANTNSSNLFSGFKKVTSIENLNNLDTSNTTNMQSMFSGMNALTTLNLIDFDTSQVTDMSNMFGNLKTLQNLDISPIDTSKVVEMDAMFMGCSNLVEINGLDNLNTSNVNIMSQMFQDCSNITTLDLSHFDNKNVRYISNIFSGMNNLKILNLSNWTFNDTNCKLFISTTNLWNLSNLEKMILNDVNTSDVTDMSGMFSGLINCTHLTSLDLSDFDTSNVEKMNSMFSGSMNLQEINLNGFVTKKLTTMSGMFDECRMLKKVDLSSFDTSNVTDMKHMFAGAISLQEVNISNFDTSNVTDMTYMFGGTTSLSSITFGPNFIHKDGAITAGMFYGCHSSNRPTDSSWQDVSYD